MVGITVHGETLDAEHVSVFSLVEFAYNLRDVELSGGPAWVRSDILATSELYQVIAKTNCRPSAADGGLPADARDTACGSIPT